MMATAENRQVPATHAVTSPARKLIRPVAALAAVIGFQLLLASVFIGVLHRPALHDAPVAVAGSSRLVSALQAHGADGAIRLVPEPDAAAAQAAIRDQQVYAAVVAGPSGDELLTAAARSPGTATILTAGLTQAAVKVHVPLQVRDLEPLPPSDPSGISAFFLVVGWILGGYVGATVLGLMLGGMRSKSSRQAAQRLVMLAGYAAASGLVGALLIGPVMGVVSGYNLALAGLGILVTSASAVATAGLQGALGLPGTLIAVIGMVVIGDPTAGQSIATSLLARPWNVIGQGLPPGAGLTAARSVIYLNGTGLTGPLTVLAVYVLAGALLMLAAAARRQRRQAATLTATTATTAATPAAAAA
jgi:hypothetical protein